MRIGLVCRAIADDLRPGARVLGHQAVGAIPLAMAEAKADQFGVVGDWNNAWVAQKDPPVEPHVLRLAVISAGV